MTDEFDQSEISYDPDNPESSKDFLRDPTDWSNPAEKMRRQKAIKTGVIAVAAVALVGGGIFLGKNAMEGDPTPEPVPTQTSTTPGNVVEASLDKPLVKAYPNAPAARPGAVKITVNKGVVASSDGNSLTALSSRVQAAVDQCQATSVTDFCLAARGNTAGVAYDAYYLKDAVNSRLFEGPKNYRALTISGAKAAAVLDLNLGKEQRPTIVAVNQNSSGWMLLLKGDIQPKNIDEVAAKLKVSTTG